jgi:anti-sigma B factor antagonist
VDISVLKHGEVQAIKLRGDLKIGAPVDALRQTIEEILGGGDSRLVIDLEEVPMIDSSGIGVLVRSLTSAKSRGGDLRLVNPSRLAVQTLKIVGLLKLFQVFGDEKEALASFQ